jgi:hypothetical protein
MSARIRGATRCYRRRGALATAAPLALRLIARLAPKASHSEDKANVLRKTVYNVTVYARHERHGRVGTTPAPYS